MRSLSGTITADHTHDDTGHDEQAQQCDDQLNHASVPLCAPSHMENVIAKMNRAVMIHTRSMLPPRHPYAHGHCYHVVGDDDQLYYHMNIPVYSAKASTQAQKMKLVRILVYTRNRGRICPGSYILLSCDCDAFANNQKEKHMAFFLHELMELVLLISAVAVTWAVPRPQWVSRAYTRIARFFGSPRTFN